MMTDTATTTASAKGVILGIETSCDETAAAVVTTDGRIRSNIIASARRPG